MSLTVSKIIWVSKHAVLREMHRMNYIMNNPLQITTTHIGCNLLDPKSGKSVPARWTIEEDTQGTLANKVKLATGLMKNMVWSLDSIVGLHESKEFYE